MIRRRASSSSSRAFTLIEVIVVVVIMAILAGMLIPRFARTRERQFRLMAEEVLDLTMMFAQREALGQRPIGLWYDGEQHQLEVLILEPDPSDPSGDEEWRADVSINPVSLPEWVDPPVVLWDERYVDIQRWPLTSEPGQRRPRLELSLRSDNLTASVILMPHAITPRLYGLDAVTALPDRQIIDLDAAGRSREDW